MLPFNNRDSVQPVIEGVSDKLDELKLDLDDERLLEITQKWLDIGEKYRTTLVERYKGAKSYYIGESTWRRATSYS